MTTMPGKQHSRRVGGQHRRRLQASRLLRAPLVAAACIGVAITAGVTIALPSGASSPATGEASLQAAFAVSGSTVQLQNDVSITDGTDLAVPSGGTITLDLNGNKLSISGVANDLAGIAVPAGAGLTIEDTSAAGSGTLTVAGDGTAAGIGGGYQGAGGSVTVSGGSVTAAGGAYGAGIGGGYQGAGGSVTVSGGSLTATGGNSAAGIGGGYLGAGGSVSASGSSITVGGGFTAIGAGQSPAASTFGSLSLGSGATLTVASGSKLSIPSGTTVANAGTIVGSVDLSGGGVITGNDYAFSLDDGSGGPATSLDVYAPSVDATTLSLGTPAVPASQPAGSVFAGWFTSAKVGSTAAGFPETDSTLLQPFFGSATSTGPVQIALAAKYGVPITDPNVVLTAFNAGGLVVLGADFANPLTGLTVPASGTVILDLNGHLLNTFSVSGAAGIGVGTGSSLVVEDASPGGGGRLMATGDQNAAGIGGIERVVAGSVVVSGGSVTAHGGSSAAGIGGGDGGSGGSVVVSGGSVLANGEGYGAGIGGGYQGAGGSVLVAGGSVRAAGGAYGAGIGGGYTGAGASVAVSGGSVTATGGFQAAGIGGGIGGAGGSVVVSGGSVTATAGDAGAAGIGGGLEAAGGSVVVSGGSVTSGGSTAVGPGGGAHEFGSLSVGSGATLTAAAGSTLEIPEGVTVQNDGTILGAVQLDGDGSITDDAYRLVLDADNGPGQSPSLFLYAASVKNSGQTLGTLTPSAHESFSGWFTAASGGSQVTDTSDLPALFGAGPAVATLYAQYGLDGTPASFTKDTPGVLGAVGTPYSYSYAVTPASDGTTPVFGVASGSLPPGLLLDPTSGLLSGTPKTGGTYTFTVKTGDSVVDAVTPSTSITVEAPGTTFINERTDTTGSVASVPAGGGTPVPLAVSGLVTPRAMTLDAAGDLFIVDEQGAQVVKVPADGSTQTTVGTGFTDPDGVAVDAAGDVFVTDSYIPPDAIGPSPDDGKVVEVPAGGGPEFTVPGTTTLFDPAGLSVDSAGDLFIADNDDGQVVELPAGSSTLKVISPDVTAPEAAQVDAAGDVFISDNRGSDPGLQGQVVEVPAGGGAQKPVGPQLGQADGLAEDTAGNLIVADAVNGDVVKIAPDGSSSPVASGLTDPIGVAVFAPPPSFVDDTPSTSGTVGVAYPQYTFSASSPGGEPDPTFRVATGALPPGLTLDPVTGVLSGKPTQSGPFTFQVEAGNVATGVLGPSTTITVAPAAAATDVLQVSVHSDRSSPVDLAGSQLSGSVYVFAAVPASDRSVVFSLDGSVFHTEGGAPFDFNGTGVFTGSSSVAYPFATGSLSDGSHTISVVVTDAGGKVTTASSSFTVANNATAPPQVLQVSTHADRSGSVNLNGSSLSGPVYVFANVPATDRSVVFTLDGSPFHTEMGAPFDFNGTGTFTGSSSVAIPFPTSSLVDGTHTVTETAVSSMGVATSTSASFTVTNGTTAPPPASVPLRVSTNADRSGAFNLTGSTLTGTVYVFDVPTVPTTQVVSVQFSLDGKVFHTEMGTPFDFNGTADAVNALPYSLNGLSKAKHTITALVTFTNGKTETDTGAFTVT